MARRLTAAVSVVLLVMVAVAIAEASLMVLLFVFSAVLRLGLSLELGTRFVQTYGMPGDLQVIIRTAGTVGSVLFTSVSGLAAAAWQFRRWQPSA